jgi:hypothetical protein
MTLEKLQSAIKLVKSGDKQSARQLLLEILKSDPHNEKAWLWLSACVDTIEQRKYCLEKVLAINPNNVEVHNALHSLQNRQQAIAVNEKTSSEALSSSDYKSLPSARQNMVPSSKPRKTNAKKPVSVPLLLGGIALLLICLISTVLLGVNALYKPFDGGSNPIFSSQATSTPTISDEKISSEIQSYYENTLNISVDLTSRGFGIVPLPAKDYFQVSNITVVDKSISGNQATIIARMKFTIIDMPAMDSPSWEALLKYFGELKFVEQTFEQERKFLFQQYESGAWKLEREPDIEAP